MSRVFLRRLVYMLATLQLLLAAPMASALVQSAAVDARLAAELHIGVTDNASDPCHCCPDGVTDIASCLSACGPAAAPLPVVAVAVARSAPALTPAFTFVPHVFPADPPLNPPPID